MFHWKKGTDDEDAITTYDPRDAPPWSSTDEGRSKRHKRRHASGPAQVEAPPVEPAPVGALAADAELAALAQRLQELGAAFARERAAAEARVGELTNEIARATEASARRAQEAEAEAERLRAELGQRDETLRMEREESSLIRRRVEGFEGLKRAMQSL